LFDIGREYDLERHAMANMLDQDQFRHGVLAREAQLRRGGVSGVPGFLVNDRLFVVGAQPAVTLVDVFDRVMFGAESDLPLQGLVH
jgi:predicted DsbA family dithiol-disulfide isomerase